VSIFLSPFLSDTMPSCWNLKNVLRIAIAASLTVVGHAFLTPTPTFKSSRMPAGVFFMTAETVQVCGFKDCKRAGGGPRLEKLFKEVLEEKGLTDSVSVECAECQGECGYGPNVLVDGKLINSVRGREAVMQALGISQEE
jgi:hypothetical protein